MFKKVNSVSLTAIAYEEIKSNIIKNRLKPGDRLGIEDISKQLGISRTPVANAMQALERDRYVHVFPQKGCFVRELTRDELKTIYDIRKLLESYLIREASIDEAESALMSFREKFSAYLTSDRKNRKLDSKTINDFYQLELAFHDFIGTSCPDIIEKEVKNIIDHTKRTRLLLLEKKLDQGKIKDIEEEDIKIHVELIDALLSSNLKLAERIIKKDIERTKEEVLEELYD